MFVNNFFLNTLYMPKLNRHCGLTCSYSIFVLVVILVLGPFAFVQGEEWKPITLFSPEELSKELKISISSNLELVNDPVDPTRKAICFKNKEAEKNHACLSVPFPNIGIESVGAVCFKIMIATDQTASDVRIGFSSKTLYPLQPIMNLNIFLQITELGGALFSEKGNKLGNFKPNLWQRLWIVLKNDKEAGPFSYIAFLNDNVDGADEKPEINSTINIYSVEKKTFNSTLGFVIGGGKDSVCSVYLSDCYFSDGENLTVPQHP